MEGWGGGRKKQNSFQLGTWSCPFEAINHPGASGLAPKGSHVTLFLSSRVLTSLVNYCGKGRVYYPAWSAWHSQSPPLCSGSERLNEALQVQAPLGRPPTVKGGALRVVGAHRDLPDPNFRVGLRVSSPARPLRTLCTPSLITQRTGWFGVSRPSAWGVPGEVLTTRWAGAPGDWGGGGS